MNTNGLREGRKRRSLFNWLKKNHNAESKITFLQETHSDENNEEDWFNDWGTRDIIFAHGDSGSKGVAIILPSNIEYTIIASQRDPNGRFLAINITLNGTTLWIINCYAPNSNAPAQQLEWLQQIVEILEPVSDSNIIV